MKAVDYYREFGGKGMRLWLHANPDALSELVSNTGDMPEDSTPQERLYAAMTGTDWRCRCGDRKRFRKLDKGFFATCGKPECKTSSKAARAKATFTEKYGADHWTKSPEMRNKMSGKNNPVKAAETMMERHGVTHALKSSESMSKMKTTLESRGGLRTDEIRERKRETSKARYGVGNPMQNDVVKAKAAASQREGFLSHAAESAKSLGLILLNDGSLRVFEFACDKCGYTGSLSNSAFNVRVRAKSSPCPKCNPPTYKSGIESEMFEFIRALAPDAVQGRRFGKHELDVYVPSMKLGFEMNGLYWHSELHKVKAYHRDKKQFFEDIGINAVMVWEDEWHSDAVKERIRSVLGHSQVANARSCDIVDVPAKETREFLDARHLQGAGREASVRYGLRMGDRLVMVMTFARAPWGWELLRMASEGRIRGGASKLFKRFISDHSPEFVLCYADRCWSSAESGVYGRIGFTLAGTTDPDLHYFGKDNVRVPRQTYQRHKLHKHGMCEADDTRPASEILAENKVFRIFGPGHLRYEWRQK